VRVVLGVSPGGSRLRHWGSRSEIARQNANDYEGVVEVVMDSLGGISWQEAGPKQ